MRLTEPIRNAEDPDFSNFVNAIGDGAGPSIPLNGLRIVYTAQDLIDFVYPSHILLHPHHCLQRAILAPTNAQVDMYNDAILRAFSGDTRTYLAADSLKEVDDAGLVPPDSVLDYVEKNTPPGLPKHGLTIKKGGVYRLLRNLSLDRGLVKNIRVVVTNTGSRLITVKLLHSLDTIGGADEEILIPRITFSTELSSGYTLLRRQFPLAIAYATTFNSCQGLTLDVIGIELTQSVFSHGQLYTTLSRIRNRNDVAIRLRAGEMSTENVTFQEILV